MGTSDGTRKRLREFKRKEDQVVLVLRRDQSTEGKPLEAAGASRKRSTKMKERVILTVYSFVLIFFTTKLQFKFLLEMLPTCHYTPPQSIIHFVSFLFLIKVHMMLVYFNMDRCRYLSLSCSPFYVYFCNLTTPKSKKSIRKNKI